MFYSKYTHDGRLESKCKECNKASSHRRRHAKKVALAGRPRPEHCEVCGRKSRNGLGLHWDHCHVGGHFRGWLCDNCNHTLGLVQDRPALLRQLADYLERSGPGSLPFREWAPLPT
jgi:Recombination endonuclease VII